VRLTLFRYVLLALATSITMSVANACAGNSAIATSPSSSPSLDSLVLARGACYGTCEVYEFVVRRAGTATLRKKSVESRVSVMPDAARQLLAAAVDAGVLTLPSLIQSDSTLCPLEASDHSTIVLTAYGAGRVNRIEHYTGCYISHDLRVAPRLERLVIFERRVDSLATVH
jgi:hypothetical protein